MDVELLSRIIRELIVDHDEVALPQVGTFVAEMVPASFSDRGYTVNPPYRRLSFVQRPGSDSLLVDFYAKANGMDLRMAESYLVDFLSELRKVLEERKVVVLPGLGRLRATRENALFFVPEEDLDIYPEGFGLRSVSLKHIPSEQEAVEIPVSFADAVPGRMEAPAPDTVPLPGETAAPVSAGQPSSGRGKALKAVLITLGTCAVVAGLLLAVFLILADVAPDFIDSILYTPEELRIIHY